ncbi:unnamed protein product [Sphagnum jensenii]|uniref:C-terminal of Roc (COR) domain-containing protein n=1 Tax=Sphagnum jensenii TaxID=128206 RepID=A0ABP0WZL5_9BRYO
MADAIVTDVVQEVLRILTASDVVVEEFEYDGPIVENSVYTGQYHRCKSDSSEGRLEESLDDGDVEREWSLSGGSFLVESTNVKDGTREDIILRMKYHQCKADSREGRLEERLVGGVVERRWTISRGDDLKEVVSTVLESTNVKAIRVFSGWQSYNHGVIEQFLQGLRTNHTIVSATFNLVSPQNTTVVVDKSVVMLRHNIGLKHFGLLLSSDIKGITKHSGFGDALKMNHTLQRLQIHFHDNSPELDLEELVQPLIMDKNGHQANSTLTTLDVTGLFAMGSVGATFARMLRKNSSIKRLSLVQSLEFASYVQELIQSLVENHSLETLDLRYCNGVFRSLFPVIMDVLRVNFTLENIELWGTPLDYGSQSLAIKKQLQGNRLYKKLHLKDLEMAKPTSARVIFCGSPYAGKTTLRKAVVRSIEHRNTISKSILNPCKDFMMKKIDGGQRLIQGNKQITHRTRGIEVHSLKSSEGIRWSIWDMGGQEEFHGFHYFMLPDLSDTGNPSLFLLVCSPYVLRDEGTPSKEKVKLPIEIQKELEYWLRFIASKSRRTISFKPKVIMVLTHSDKVPGLVARAQESVTSLKEQFAELLDVWSEPIAVDGFSTESGSNVASVIEDNIVTLLKALPPVYKVCSDVRSALKGWMVRNPKCPMMNWKTFSDLCQETDLPGLVKATVEGSMIEARRKAVATSMHNSGDVIYFEDLDFLVVDLDWFCHRVMGHLIKLSDDRSKLATATNPDGFTSRAYLENILVDSLKSSRELGYGGCALDVTAQNLVQLMLRLELCFEDTTGSHGVGKLFIPTILDIGQVAGSWNWSDISQKSIYFGRRLQCADPEHTFIPRGLFCRLQVFLHNRFLTLEKDMNMRALYEPKNNFIYIMLNGVEVVVDYNADVGTHIDVLVHSKSKSFDDALDIVHEHIMDKILERCVATDGCQGVVLVEGVIRTMCVKNCMSFKERQGQSVLLEELKRNVFSHGNEYEHPWGELRQGENVIRRENEFAKMLMGRGERDEVVERHKQALQIDEVDGVHDKAAMDTRGWTRSSSSKTLVNLKNVMQEPSQEQNQALRKLAYDFEHLAGVVHDTNNTVHDTHKLVRDEGLQLTRFIHKLIVNSSQRQVPRIVLFTTGDVSFKQKLITKLVPGMKAPQLHLLCEYKGQEHIVEGQAGCQVIIEDEDWKNVHELVVEGLKWFQLAVKVGAHITMGLENMVPIPKMEYGKDVVAPGKLVRDEASAIRTAESVSAEQWLVNFLKDKVILTQFGLQRVVYKDTHGRQTGELGWICQKHFDQGMCVGELDGFPCP